MTTKRRIRRRRLSALALAAATLAGGAAFAVDPSGAAAQTFNAQQQVSQNWSGYIAQSSSGQNFSSVSGSWVQPAVSANTGTGYSAFWVGLGGATGQSQSLEQVGTAADVSNGNTTYYAWYELVPSAEQQLSLAIHPGDHISGKVTVNGTNVTISLSDQTTGQSVTKTLQMSNPDTSSAEWIAEAPAAQIAPGEDQILPLANFGSVTFTNASATAGGNTGSIADPNWTVQQVDMSSGGQASGFGPAGRFGAAGLGGNGLSTAGATAGTVSSGGSSFTVSYSPDSSAQSTATAAGYGYGYGGGYGYAGSGYGGGYPYGAYGYGGYGGSYGFLGG
jgi:hypothetical protein